MTKRTSFKISIEKIVIEYRGDEETGEQLQAGVTQLVGGITSAPAMLLQNGDNNSDENVVQGTATKPKKTRAPRTRGGTSTAKLIAALIGEGFFSERKSVADASSELLNKGHTIKSNRIATVLQKLTQEGTLSRETNEAGKFVYWSTG